MSEHNIEYRPYQVAARDAGMQCFQEDADSALVVLPTGTGKTVLAGMFSEEFAEVGHKTLFLAHRKVLIEQAYKTYSRFGFAVATEMGEYNAMSGALNLSDTDVVVGSIQTFQADRLLRWPVETFGLIVIDAAHRSLADSYTKILNHFTG